MNDLEIPRLNNPQCSVIQAETKSGIVLTIEGKYFLNNSKDIYFLTFDSFEEAKAFCETKIKENPAIEYNIYNYLTELIEVIRFQ
jgi:hypothetical protein